MRPRQKSGREIQRRAVWADNAVGRRVNALEERGTALIAVPTDLQGAYGAQSLRQRRHVTSLNGSDWSACVRCRASCSPIGGAVWPERCGLTWPRGHLWLAGCQLGAPLRGSWFFAHLLAIQGRGKWQTERIINPEVHVLSWNDSFGNLHHLIAL